MRSQVGDKLLEVVSVFQSPFKFVQHGETVPDFIDHRLDILNCSIRDDQLDVIGQLRSILDSLGWSKLDTIALGEFLMVGECIGKSRKSAEDALSLELVAQEVLVKFGLLSSGVIGVFRLVAAFILNLPRKPQALRIDC